MASGTPLKHLDRNHDHGSTPKWGTRPVSLAIKIRNANSSSDIPSGILDALSLLLPQSFLHDQEGPPGKTIGSQGSASLSE
jgi:hypothetical protein